MRFVRQPDHDRRTFWTPARVAATSALLALISTFGISSCGKPVEDMGTPKATVTVNASGPNAPKRPASVGPTTMPAKVLEANLETIIDGKPFKLSDLKDKVFVLDLWATWCGPCRSSTPELVSLQKEFGSRGFEVIGLDIDPDSDTPEDVKAFADEFKINYKLAFADRELAMSLMRGGNIPQTLVVGRDGRIVEHLVGFNPVVMPKKLRAAIEQALEK